MSEGTFLRYSRITVALFAEESWVLAWNATSQPFCIEPESIKRFV